jgi:hypothetical protein
MHLLLFLTKKSKKRRKFVRRVHCIVQFSIDKWERNDYNINTNNRSGLIKEV